MVFILSNWSSQFEIKHLVCVCAQAAPVKAAEENCS